MQIKLNSDKSFVAEIREAIKLNGGHCCCAIEKNEDSLCMCADFRKQITAGISGKCHCGLYELVLDKEDKR